MEIEQNQKNLNKIRLEIIDLIKPKGMTLDDILKKN